MIKIVFLASCLIGLGLTSSAVFAKSTVSVGDPAKPSGLASAIQGAYASGARDIVIKRGVYSIPPGRGDIVFLDHWQDARISAYGVEIIANGQSWPDAVFDLRHCKNVTVAGPLLSQTEVTAYQGKVTAIDTGNGQPDSYSFTWVPDAGYPTFLDSTTKFPSINVVDAKTRLLKLGIGDFYSITGQSIGNGAFKLTGFGRFSTRIAVGDWFVARHSEIPIVNKIHLDGCENCTIKDVSMMRNGFAPIFETGGVGGNHILGCKWLLGPKPVGANEQPLVSTMADGLHSTGTQTGPDIEHCSMEGVLLDDCFAIHGRFDNVISSSGADLVVKGDGNQYAVGEPIQVCDGSGLYAAAQVTAVTDHQDGTATVTTNPAINASSAAKAFNPNRCGAGYKIIGCQIGRTRSRGILVKGNNGLIEGNTIVMCGMPAVSIGPEFYWGEAGYVKNVVVQDNEIVNCGSSGNGGSAILVHGEGSMGNSDIAIKDNRFFDDYQGEFQVEWTSNVTISGNQTLGLLKWPSVFREPNFAHISNCQTVNLSGNTVKNPTVYNTPLVAIGENVAGLTGNDDSGVHVQGK